MSALLTRPYADRREAGRHLARLLLMYRGRPEAIVLAVSRSAVPIGDGIAESLELPLDVFTVGIGFTARSTYLPDQRVLANAGISLSAFTETAKRATARERLEKSVARFVCANALDAETQLQAWYLDASEPDGETVRATLDDARGRLAPAKHSDIILKQSINQK